MINNYMDSQQLGIAHKIFKPWREFLSPEDLNQVEECSIPRNFYRNCHLPATDSVSVSFLGDMTNLISNATSIGQNLLSELTKSQYIIINLEALPIDEKGFLLNKNFVSKEFLKKIVDTFPNQKIIFGLANNHAYDYGEDGLTKTIEILKSIGADFVGTSKKPNIYLKDNLRLDAHTLWHTNQDHSMSQVSMKNELKTDDQVIKFLHWGKAFEEMPTDTQIENVERLNDPLLVCGHHGHCPQPIQYVKQTLCAYSLGDFISQSNSNAVERGIHFRVEFSKNQQWHIHSTHWGFLTQTNNEVEIHV